MSYIPYNYNVYEIELAEDFSNWLDNLKDSKVRKVVVKSIRTISLGTFGDVRSLNNGLFEAKIHYGAGYRLYFVNCGKRIIIMLCGGDKSSQNKDIKKARELAKEI